MTAHEITSQPPLIAYFSMEVGLDPALPTYSGGLGILSGDTLRSAADLQVPMVGVTLLYRKGFFRQRLDAAGRQTEEPEAWQPEEALERLAPVVTVTVEGRPVRLRAWRYAIRGVTGHVVPVYLLDTALPENAAEAQHRPMGDAKRARPARSRRCPSTRGECPFAGVLARRGGQPTTEWLG